MGPSTISAALSASAMRHPANGFTFQDGDGQEARLAFSDLPAVVHACAAALQALGVKSGDRVGLIEADVRAFVVTFLALIECGAVAVPMAPPTNVAARSDYLEHVATILREARASILLHGERGTLFSELGQAVGHPLRVVPTQALCGQSSDFRPVRVSAPDLAFLQFTSGSTGLPKGVRVTHQALVANISAFMHRLEADPSTDCGVSWLPLYHDMGLIGFVLAPLYRGVSCALVPTVRFIRKPTVWLDAIVRHRGTISFSPSFAFSLLTRRVRQEDVSRWDLSSIKALGCGAEPIHADTLSRFAAHFQAAGVRPSMLVPAYGLAESCLAVTMKRIGAPLQTRERIDERHKCHLDVACGPPLDGHEVEIRSSDGTVLPAGQEGEVWTTGPSVADGYYENPGAGARSFVDGWLRTGDLGYLHDGQLFVTGRLKELVIINGRNHHPQTFEWATAEVEGVRSGNVVAFSQPGEATEELVILAEVTRARPDLKREISVRVQQRCGVTPTVIELMSPGSLPKTSSGKLKRSEAREVYLGGTMK